METIQEESQVVVEPSVSVEETAPSSLETTPQAPSEGVEADDEYKNETARETVARVLKNQQNKDGNLQGDQGKGKETTNATKPIKEKASVLGASADESLTPPNRLSAKEKEIFNKLPQEFKPAIARMFKEHQSEFHRAQTELSNHIREVSHIQEAVRPYYVSHPELASNGITESAFIAGLVGAHMELTNPKTDRAKIEAIARDRGYNIRFLDDDGEELGDEPRKTDITEHPQFRALQEQTNRLMSFIEGQQRTAIVDPITKEWDTIREEKAADGSYVYPRMHEADFWDTARPLITALTNSGMPHGEALKRAYVAIEGAPHSHTTPPGFPSNKKTINANASVRGRSVPSTGGYEIATDKIPDSARDTVRMVIEQLGRGNLN